MKIFRSLLALASSATLLGAVQANEELYVVFETTAGATGPEIHIVMSALGGGGPTTIYDDVTGTKSTYEGRRRLTEENSPMLRGEDERHRKLCRLGPQCHSRHTATMCKRYNCGRRLQATTTTPEDEALELMKTVQDQVSFDIETTVDIWVTPDGF